MTRQTLYSRTYKDVSGEKSSVTFRIRENFTDATERQSAISSLGAALDGVSSGNSVGFRVSEVETVGNGNATDPNANREVKLVLFFYDNVSFKQYTREIPVVIRGTLTTFANSDDVDLTVAPMALLVTRLQADALSVEGNPITITRATIVGRNL